ncbi:MAG: ester cyclase [Ktedonobacterales bacterium]
MTNEECVRTFISAVNARNWLEARSYLDDTFQFRGLPPLTQFMNASTFIDALQALVAAVPDHVLNTALVQSEAETITLSLQVSGTHEYPFIMPRSLQQNVDGAPIQADHQPLVLPEEILKFSLHQAKITAIELSLPAGTSAPTLFPSQRHPPHTLLRSDEE